MVDISIVDGGYKLTNITGGYHIAWYTYQHSCIIEPKLISCMEIRNILDWNIRIVLILKQKSVHTEEYLYGFNWTHDNSNQELERFLPLKWLSL